MKTFLDNWCNIPTEYATFRMYDTSDENMHLISYGDIHQLDEPLLVRIHSSCLASEVFGARDCDCAHQLQQSMRHLSAKKQGIIIYLRQEGRGQGLANKIKGCSLMQKENLNTVEAYQRLGLKEDTRDYSQAVKLLKQMNIKKIELITNNPRKIDFFAQHNIEITKVVSLPLNITPQNKKYIISKYEHLGHIISPYKFFPNAPNIYFSDHVYFYKDFSNFSPHAISTEGQIWKTVEHYYQANKFTDKTIIEEICSASLPIQAKEIARTYQTKIKPDWESLKQKVMYQALRLKFTQNLELKKLLLETGGKKIYELSAEDRYWGDPGDGTGQNHLGKLLMKLRTEIRGQ